MLTRVHHVGLVVRRLEDGLAFWQDALGLQVSKQATVADQGVKAALLPIGRSEIELLEPIDPAGGVAKFLEKRGEGLHHVCFETPDVAGELERARGAGFPLIDETPRAGLAGTICFLHPEGHARRARRVRHAAARRRASRERRSRRTRRPRARRGHGAQPRHGRGRHRLFVDKLGLERAGADAVTVGGVRLRFLADDTGSEGLAGLVLDVADAVAARAALEALRTPPPSRTDSISIRRAVAGSRSACGAAPDPASHGPDPLRPRRLPAPRPAPNVWAGTLGPWLYVVLFLVLFCETGLVVTPFLPGDSLLFAVGALVSIEDSPIKLPVVLLVLWAAAVIGDAVNYAIGTLPRTEGVLQSAILAAQPAITCAARRSSTRGTAA